VTAAHSTSPGQAIIRAPQGAWAGRNKGKKRARPGERGNRRHRRVRIWAGPWGHGVQVEMAANQVRWPSPSFSRYHEALAEAQAFDPPYSRRPTPDVLTVSSPLVALPQGRLSRSPAAPAPVPRADTEPEQSRTPPGSGLRICSAEQQGPITPPPRSQAAQSRNRAHSSSAVGAAQGSPLPSETVSRRDRSRHTHTAAAGTK